MNKARLRARPARASGNGVVVGVRSQRGAWVVEFMSEPRNGPECLWFNLECTGAGDRKVRFVWLNVHLCLGTGSAEAMANLRPVLRLDNGDWQRVRGVEVHQRRLGGHYVTFSTPTRCRRVAAAFCYPYGPAEMGATLKETKGFWGLERIGLTQKGREIVRLHAEADRARRGRPGAYIMARQHSGETPGSWVLDGILRAVAGEEPGERLRRIDWWIVPFVDLDGVVEGNYGKDSLPIDFNRAWARMPMRPEVAAIQKDIRYFAQDRTRRLVVDLHAPGGGETNLYQMHCRKDRPKAERTASQSFNSYFSAQFPEQSPDRLGVEPKYASRWDLGHSLSSWTWDELDNTLGVTIETAYQLMNDGRWGERGDYRNVGHRIARAAAAWLTRRPAKSR